MEHREIYTPNREFAKQARIKNMCEYKDLMDWAREDYEGFWDHWAKEKIDWFEPYHTVLDESDAPFYKWFVGGKLNVTHQCIDRHIEVRKNKAAIIFEGDRGDKQVITYLELYRNVNRFANLLKNRFGVKKGDRVILYMPMIPEAAYAMLACARLGAIHSVVPDWERSIRSSSADSAPKRCATASSTRRRKWSSPPMAPSARTNPTCSNRSSTKPSKRGANVSRRSWSSSATWRMSSGSRGATTATTS